MTLLQSLTAAPPPLDPGDDGVLRVRGTRVRFDTVLTAFHGGSSAEEIVLKYPVLDLTDVYALITYYLWHKAEVDSYLAERAETSRAARVELESRFPPDGIRARLLSRREPRS